MSNQSFWQTCDSSMMVWILGLWTHIWFWAHTASHAGLYKPCNPRTAVHASREGLSMTKSFNACYGIAFFWCVWSGVHEIHRKSRVMYFSMVWSMMIQHDSTTIQMRVMQCSLNSASSQLIVSATLTLPRSMLWHRFNSSPLTYLLRRF